MLNFPFGTLILHYNYFFFLLQHISIFFASNHPFSYIATEVTPKRESYGRAGSEGLERKTFKDRRDSQLYFDKKEQQ
jgi:hypothetical protein